MWGPGASGRQFPKGTSVSKHNGFQLSDFFLFCSLGLFGLEYSSSPYDRILQPLYCASPSLPDLPKRFNESAR